MNMVSGKSMLVPALNQDNIASLQQSFGLSGGYDQYSEPKYNFRLWFQIMVSRWNNVSEVRHYLGGTIPTVT